ncbi:lysophospholipid acyltransferase family protein [Acholeplasma hippikon]|uniref:2-acyl-glycerophospho-ethanolamine acyltransferase n=1 Tax=Acholeplasma hippikon TaxID=264636 RepID=A0A449BIR8_9MOLU|nr:lysophospholipid acyltransferase family protein [Acholeplasma hippikon]VEU82330.1 2-acyl-glycerophospho-ethanolamine acyltransferase [Acholeplasma hippikon]
MKKQKEVKIRHFIIGRIAKPFVIIVLKIKYKYHYRNHKELKNKGPFLVLGNHTVPVDPILMGLNFPFHLYYFATEQIFNLGLLSKLLIFAVNPIKKSKSLSDLSAIRKAKKIVQEGGSVAVFPEGNVTYDGQTSHINPSIVKLVRLLRIPVIFYKTKGFYLSNPRWTLKVKRGYTESYIENILYPNDYEKMDDDELYEVIKKSLYVNAYEDQFLQTYEYKGIKLALGLERLIFIDFTNDTPFVTYTKKNKLLSKSSDLCLTYQSNGFIKYNENTTNLIELNQEVIKSYLRFLKQTKEDFITLDRAKVYDFREKRRKRLNNHIVHLYKHKLLLISKKEIELTFNQIINLAIQGKRKLIIYTKDKNYLLTFNKNVSPYKYLLTYQNYLSQKEGRENGEFYKFGLQ